MPPHSSNEGIESDFFDSSFGSEGGVWRLRGRLLDLAYDTRLLVTSAYSGLRTKIRHQPVRHILIAGVEVPERSQELQSVMRRLSQSRHQVTLQPAPLIAGKGKFQNINEVLKGSNLEAYDWIVIVDDDIAFQRGFLDRFICIAERADLHIAMPAHRFRSFHTFAVTKRKWNSLARVTHYVESGPVTAFRKSVLSEVFPFAELRWAWGTDIAWSEAARNKGLRIGVVDAAPIRHLRPVAESYDKALARDEAKAFLERANICRRRSDILKTVEIITSL